MPLWLIIVLGVIAVAVAVFFGMLFLTRQKSGAGIVTARTGRTMRLFLSGARMSTRYAIRTVRRFFTSKKKRAELDRRFHDENARAERPRRPLRAVSVG